ncbi:MAG: hypothetical protein ACHQAQ_10235 [Hyphomicrobiales bacterium]
MRFAVLPPASLCGSN